MSQEISISTIILSVVKWLKDFGFSFSLLIRLLAMCKPKLPFLNVQGAQCK